MEAILFSVVSFFSTSLGGVFAIKNEKKLHFIMSFTAGVVIGVSFFDILPEALRIINQNNFGTTMFSLFIVLGFIVFHILERSIIIHHAHEDEYRSHTHPTVGIIGALGLSIHSFLDGIGIGLGFQVNNQMGLIIALAVIAHDFSDGINTVALLLTHKNKTKKAYLLLFLDAVAPILGAASTLLFTISDSALLLYLGFFMGFLIYIGASDLLPEAHSEHSSYKMIGLTLLGIAFIFTISRLL